MIQLMSGEKGRTTIRVLLLWLIFYSFYVFGLIFPDYWWSTHFLAFLPEPWGIVWLVVAGILPFVILIFKSKDILPNERHNENKAASHLIIVGISTVMAALFYNFPMAHDFYGEAPKLLQFLEQVPSSIPEQANTDFFTFSLSPWAGQQTILGLVTYIAYLFQVTYREAFYLLDTVCGFFFVLTWLYFIESNFTDNLSKLILLLAGLTAPFLLNFYGHIEINAPVLLFNLLWLVLLVNYLDKARNWKLWLLLFLLIVCIKLHSVALLFVPILIFIFIRHYAPVLAEKYRLLTWKRVALLIFTPVFIAGAILYFFVFEDYKDPRHIQFTAMEYDRLFLPLLSPEAPLDRYNLLSFNHIFDYFSEMLIWSPVAFFIIILLIMMKGKSIKWNSPDIVSIGTILILFGSLFFVVNPLLSMQMDWDLFSFPATAFLVFAVLLLRQVNTKILALSLLGPVLSLAILSLPIIYVHANTDALSHRLERTSIRIFKTYYEWSTQTLRFAMEISNDDLSTIEGRMKEVIEELEPYAISGKDYEYASILRDHGTYLFKTVNDYERAMKYLERSVYYSPSGGGEANLQMLEAHFLMGNMEMAFETAEQLIELQYPDEQRSVRMGIHIALEAGYYQEAYGYSVKYLEKWPDDNIVSEIMRRIETDDRVEELKLLFARSPKG